MIAVIVLLVDIKNRILLVLIHVNNVQRELTSTTKHLHVNLVHLDIIKIQTQLIQLRANFVVPVKDLLVLLILVKLV